MSVDRSQEFVEELLRSHQDEIVRGLFRGLFALDEPSLDALAREMASACRARFLRVSNMPADLDLDGMLEWFRRAGPERIEISRTGDEIIWREQREGQCMCPLVRRDIVDLDAKMCTCSAEWTRGLVEKFHGGPVTIEIVESVATGSSSCAFRLKLGSRSQHSA